MEVVSSNLVSMVAGTGPVPDLGARRPKTNSAG